MLSYIGCYFIRARKHHSVLLILCFKKILGAFPSDFAYGTTHILTPALNFQEMNLQMEKQYGVLCAKKIDPRRQEFVLEFLIYATLLTHITHIPQKS